MTTAATAPTITDPGSELNTVSPYHQIEADLAKMEADNKALEFDVTTSKGEKLARSHIHGMRHIKGLVTARHKELKAESLAYGRSLDAVKNTLLGRVETMIDHHKKPLDEMAQKEAERVAFIQNEIDELTGGVYGDGYNANADEWREEIDRLDAIDITPETFQERMAEATTIKQETLKFMRTMHSDCVKRDKEQAELERLRKEDEARKQKEREDRIAAEAAGKAKREADERAERERVEAERKVQAERDAAEKAKHDAEELAQRERDEAATREADLVAKAKQDKADADRRVLEAEQATERKAQAERDAQAAREADDEHRVKIGDAAAKGVSDAIRDEHVVDIKEDDLLAVAETVIQAIVDSKIPHVTINF